jgi:hypothetical protein
MEKERKTEKPGNSAVVKNHGNYTTGRKKI